MIENEPGSLGQGVAYQYAYVATLTLSGAAFYLYVIHYFPPEIVGSVALLLAILQLFPLFFSLGLSYGWQHFTSYELGAGNLGKVNALLKTALRLSTWISIASDAALLLLAPYLSSLFFHSQSYIQAVYYLALDIPGSIFISFLNSIMLGLQRFKLSGMIGILYVLAVYISSIVALNITHSVDAIPEGWAIGYTLGAVLYFIEITRFLPHGKAEKYPMKQVFSYSIPLYVTGMLSYGAGYIDRLTVAYLKDLTSIGIYNLAILIAGGIGILSLPIGSVIFSKFSEFYARNDNEMIKEGVRMSANASSILYVPAALGMAAISTPVISLLASSRYTQDALPLSIILFVNAFLVVGGPLSNALQGTRKTYIFILSTSAALLSNISLSILLIPHFDLVGAAIGYSSTSIVSVAIIYYFARAYGVLNIDWKSISKIWSSAAVMFAVVYLVATLTSERLLFVPLYVLIGIAVYLLMLRLTSAVTDRDREVLSSLFPDNFWVTRVILRLI
jgi:O-antigen/teichoic acid export membrane protein